MNRAPVFYNDVQEKEIRQFIQDQWGSEDNGFICHELVSEFVHTAIQAIGRINEGKVLITFGVGAREMNSPFSAFNRIELVLYASNGFNTYVDQGNVDRYLTAAAELQSLSKYPFRNDTWFGPGHTVCASDAFSQEFSYSYFLFVEHVESACLSGIGTVHFLVGIPVYEEEQDWIVNNENGSGRFIKEYLDEFKRNDNVENAFLIDVPRPVIIPR